MSLIKQLISRLQYNNDTYFKDGSFTENKREEVILIDDDEMYLFMHSYIITNAWPGVKVKLFKKFADAYRHIQSNTQVNRLIVLEYFYQFDECLSFLKRIENEFAGNEVIIASSEFPERERHLLISNNNVVGLIQKPIRLKDLEPYS